MSTATLKPIGEVHVLTISAVVVVALTPKTPIEIAESRAETQLEPTFEKAFENRTCHAVEQEWSLLAKHHPLLLYCCFLFFSDEAGGIKIKRNNVLVANRKGIFSAQFLRNIYVFHRIKKTCCTNFNATLPMGERARLVDRAPYRTSTVNCCCCCCPKRKRKIAEQLE